jgi:hypothetical protein
MMNYYTRIQASVIPGIFLCGVKNGLANLD